MRKIGLLTMALVLALGTLGMGYAAWTDEIFIDGSVRTGTVNLDVVALSGSAAMKTEDHGFEWWHGWMDDYPEGFADWYPDGRPPMYVGQAKAEERTDGSIFIWMDNLFPLPDGKHWMVDMLLHYSGSVPARLHADIASGGDDDVLAEYVTFAAYQLPGFDPAEHMDDIHEWMVPANLIDTGIQVHFCDYILVVMIVDLPQDNDLMGLYAEFRASIQAVQWNEFQEGAGFYPYE